jgi:hypothetical protein
MMRDRYAVCGSDCYLHVSSFQVGLRGSRVRLVRHGALPLLLLGKPQPNSLPDLWVVGGNSALAREIEIGEARGLGPRPQLLRAAKLDKSRERTR